MPLTTKETSLVKRVRSKIGDNPTLSDGSADTTKQVWSDAEIVDELNSSRVVVFKGKESSLETLQETEEELIILHTAISCVYVLAVDAARYARYTLQKADVKRSSPEELITVAKALEQRLQSMKDEFGETSTEVGPTVQQSIMRRYDRFKDRIVPERFERPPDAVPYTLAVSAGVGIVITIAHIFIPDYRSHTLKKTSPSGTNVLDTYYVLKSDVITDTDVVAGITYTYNIIVEDVNGNLTENKKSIQYTG